ncbi:MAG TPA: FtsX-like permease family protein [Dehalococcoidia bacterium]|nr:FtsX-like permease family protein [Dehalococcoidia bacterium]
MLTSSLSTFRDRWPVFVGATIIVALGVALVQASLLALIAAATEPIPVGLATADETALREGLDVAMMTLGMTVGISGFVAFFVISSTFSFAVAERHRDFGLLRLVGASPGQVRTLLLGEALLLGSVGTILGILIGFPLLRSEVWMLTKMNFLPEGLDVSWRPWIVAVSLATGTGVAVIASRAASSRAASVPPLQAVRDESPTDIVMSRGRWVTGTISFVGAVALFISTAVTRGDPLETSLPGLLVMIVALAALSPLLVPVVASLAFKAVAPLLRHSPISELSQANVRAGVRRAASTAAPVVVLVGLVTGFAGTIGVVNAGSRQETLRSTSGDFIVTSPESLTAELESLSKVRAVSEEVQLDVSLDAEGTTNHYEGDGLAINQSSFQQTHNMTIISGDLSLLHGETVALTQSFASGLHVHVGDSVAVGIGDVQQQLRVVAIFPYTLSGPRVLLPLETLPDRPYDRRYIIQAAPRATWESLVDQIRAVSPTASVAQLQEWVAQKNDALEEVVAKFTFAVLGLVSAYMFLATVNAVIISTATRRTEFGVARLTGLTRLQVVQMTLLEAFTVVLVGTLLGLAAAGGSIAGATVAVSAIVGEVVVVLPWELAVAISLSAATTVGLTTAVATVVTTGQQPAAVAASRE